VDALGLTERYAPEVKASTGPDSYAGWERPILAPAAGTVVFARRDRPDQPVVDNSDPAFYAPEYPNGGDPGNYVVIDHGSGEFSMLAHFQKDSLSVSAGQQVEQGQQLGLMGNSGDTTGPHVHHQLQSGPDWEFADALPHAYENGPGSHHDRGWYFTAE
jgi:murein DD-endopeptidase MepM/ murein hydrolase activator NlpD